jgi:hypothetical protein
MLIRPEEGSNMCLRKVENTSNAHTVQYRTSVEAKILRLSVTCHAERGRSVEGSKTECRRSCAVGILSCTCQVVMRRAPLFSVFVSADWQMRRPRLLAHTQFYSWLHMITGLTSPESLTWTPSTGPGGKVSALRSEYPWFDVWPERRSIVLASFVVFLSRGVRILG